MATKMEGKRALADLGAGKFSYEMVDAIKDHVDALEAELQRVGALHDGAVNELRQLEYRILRLEADLRTANARVYALVRANALTEIALRQTKRGAEKFIEFLPVAGKHVAESSKQALAYLSTVDFKGKFEALQAHPLTEHALREIERLAVQLVEYLLVAGKHVAESSKQALAYLATVDFKAGFENFKALPLNERAACEIERQLRSARDHLPAARKQVAVAVEKASAYIADLHKKAA